MCEIDLEEEKKKFCATHKRRRIEFESRKEKFLIFLASKKNFSICGQFHQRIYVQLLCIPKAQKAA